MQKLSEAIRDLEPGQLKPTNKRVWIGLIPVATETAGGLTIPDAAQKLNTYGVVSDVADDIDISIKVGDIVLVASYEGNQIKFGSETFVLVDQDAVHARLDIR